MSKVPPIGTTTYMDIKEFREAGYLQEINRRFLHPLGLALEITTHPDGTETLSGVLDCRDDPEGIYFADGVATLEKAAHIEEQLLERGLARLHLLGYVTQPLGEK